MEDERLEVCEYVGEQSTNWSLELRRKAINKMEAQVCMCLTKKHRSVKPLACTHTHALYTHKHVHESCESTHANYISHYV